MLVPVNLNSQDCPNTYVLLDCLRDRYREIDIVLNFYQVTDSESPQYQITFDELSTPGKRHYQIPPTKTVATLNDIDLVIELCALFKSIGVTQSKDIGKARRRQPGRTKRRPQ